MSRYLIPGQTHPGLRSPIGNRINQGDAVLLTELEEAIIRVVSKKPLLSPGKIQGSLLEDYPELTRDDVSWLLTDLRHRGVLVEPYNNEWRLTDERP